MGALDLGRALGNPLGLGGIKRERIRHEATQDYWDNELLPPEEKENFHLETSSSSLFFSKEGDRAFYIDCCGGFYVYSLSTPFDLRSLSNTRTELVQSNKRIFAHQGRGFFYNIRNKGLYRAPQNDHFSHYDTPPFAAITSSPEGGLLTEDGRLSLRGGILSKLERAFEQGAIASRALFLPIGQTTLSADGKYCLTYTTEASRIVIRLYALQGDTYENMKAKLCFDFASRYSSYWGNFISGVHFFIKGTSLYIQKNKIGNILQTHILPIKGLL